MSEDREHAAVGLASHRMESGNASLESREHAPIARPAVSYAAADETERAFRDELTRLLDSGVQRVCDIGGGARPSIAIERVRELGLDYLVIDASQEELDKAPAGYATSQVDMLDARAVSELVREHGLFDLVVSRWVVEHMPDGQRFHENVRIMLGPGGAALHYFPTLYTAPFVVNRVLSDELSSKLLFRTFRGRRAKFPAHYSWCRGPSRRQISRLQRCGYSVDRYYGFFGHGFYARVRPLHLLNRLMWKVLVRHPVPALTSFAVIVLTLET